MLNLPIAMLEILLAMTFLFQGLPPAITSPQAGETLRGQVEIQGRIDFPDFASAELSFSYAASDSGDAWFPIQTFSAPPADSTLAVWDTTLVTDGDYNLRLRIVLQDGSIQDTLVMNLTIRNYTPDPTATLTGIPTVTPTPLFFSQFDSPSLTGQSTPMPVGAFPTATPLPTNPAELTTAAILTTFGKAALAVLGVFAFFSLLFRLRKTA
jgi:hypothetical protein